MEWYLWSNVPWVPLYPSTMFQNPMSKPSSQKSRKTIITQKVLVKQSSNIVCCDLHTQKLICVNFYTFSNSFFLLKLTFFNLLSGELSKQPKMSLWLGKMHWNGLSGRYIGFEACKIQWHWFGVSVVSSSRKIKISGGSSIKGVQKH